MRRNRATDQSTTGDPATGPGPNPLTGGELADIAARASLIAAVLADRAAVEHRADTGRDDRAEAAITRTALTVASGTRTGSADVSITIAELSALAELAAATAEAEANADATGSPAASVVRAVPATVRRDGSVIEGDWVVTGAWLRPTTGEAR